jgi:hypothetical protein
VCGEGVRIMEGGEAALEVDADGACLGCHFVGCGFDVLDMLR